MTGRVVLTSSAVHAFYPLAAAVADEGYSSSTLLTELVITKRSRKTISTEDELDDTNSGY